MNNSSKTRPSLIETYEHDAKLSLWVPRKRFDKVSRFAVSKHRAHLKNTKNQQKETVVVIAFSSIRTKLSHAKVCGTIA